MLCSFFSLSRSAIRTIFLHLNDTRLDWMGEKLSVLYMCAALVYFFRFSFLSLYRLHGVVLSNRFQCGYRVPVCRNCIGRGRACWRSLFFSFWRLDLRLSSSSQSSCLSTLHIHIYLNLSFSRFLFRLGYRVLYGLYWFALGYFMSPGFSICIWLRRHRVSLESGLYSIESSRRIEC